MKKEDVIRKLTSRKLWLSVASFVTMLLVAFGETDSTAKEIAALIMAAASVIGYVGGEGLADSEHKTDTPVFHMDYVFPEEEEAEEES